MDAQSNITFIEAHPQNFNNNVRHSSTIKFIVIHYTSNTNDTARNNALYFHNTITKSSAHYFVSGNSIYQSVADNHAAYSVGLGSMKKPYIPNPSMYKKITNSNSISIELCGSKSGPEASDETKLTAAQLTANLLKKYNLTPKCVYRHYDVTGKPCPKWAVDTPVKWLDFQLMVNQFFYGEEEDELKDTPENYDVFRTFMDRYLQELSIKEVPWAKHAMEVCAEKGLIADGRPASPVTRAELAVVLTRLG